MINERLPPFLQKLLYDLLSSDELFFWLLVILVFLFIVLEGISKIAKEKQKKAGIKPENQNVMTQDANLNTSREYTSDIQLLSGKPDAIILEGGFKIPVERKAFSNKIRDRHIAQLLVYMRLIEEFEGKKPPYGYLVLGKNKRKVKILNTKEKQDWLQEKINEMQRILKNESQAVAAPQKQKCKFCTVKDICTKRYNH